MISLWIDTAIQSLMILPPDRDRRVGFYFDEIARLQYLPSLESGMTLSPKYGGYFILGAQSISQFEKNYGATSTNILFDACSTKAYFRLPSVKTAKWASADIGEEELEERRETMSISGNRRTGGSLSTNEQIRVRYPVSYTEIKNLEKLTAFLNLPGNWPIAKIKFTIFGKKDIAPAFIPAEIQPIKIIPIQVDEEMGDSIRERLSQMQVEEVPQEQSLLN